MKKFFKKLLTSKITHSVLFGATVGFGLLFMLSLAIPALAGILGFAIGATFVAGVAYGLTKYADFAISAKEGEKLLKQDEAEAVKVEDFVLTPDKQANKEEAVELTPEQKTRKKIEKYSIELDEMGK